VAWRAQEPCRLTPNSVPILLDPRIVDPTAGSNWRIRPARRGVQRCPHRSECRGQIQSVQELFKVQALLRSTTIVAATHHAVNTE
jgi:hypothetical protein